ncbi:hypothetical protein HELRODRAFT_83856, partial [Helobdella robusta]|uniref:Tetratricopeptide repeat protein 39B n=1 Tax=Helobdella robusta TaxID=6412 RepID=T1G5B1_HELRO
TTEEAHAELCYAELLLQQAFLTFIQDENFVSFIKGAFKVKTCLNSYKESVEIMKKRSWKENEGLEDFKTGICMGVGAFNLMISLLPPRILKVLEFVGYRGSKEKGLRELETGAMLSDTLRSPICSVLLIQYHIIISYIFGLGDGDTELSSRLLDTMQAKCPNSAIFHFLRGRIYEVSGDIDRAIMTFEESIDSQDQWKQLHHFCCWELMWCHSYLGNWLLAMKYAEKLFEESKWSKSMYAYLKGTFMMMMMMKTTTMMTMMVPRLKQRIAGKSVPVEKWAVMKVQMYYEQSEFLMLPAYEVMYVWNGFEVMGKREELIVSVISVIEEALRNLTMTSEDDAPNIMKFDNACLLNLLLGVCFRLIGQFDSAEKCFAFVIDNKKNVQRDTYLVPSCMYERGLLFMQMMKFKEAERSFDDARLVSMYVYLSHSLSLFLSLSLSLSLSFSFFLYIFFSFFLFLSMFLFLLSLSTCVCVCVCLRVCVPACVCMCVFQVSSNHN